MKPLIIFYDEPCVLCNYWVQRLCHWDKKDQLRFISLDHPSFLAFAEERGLDLNSMDTSVVWDQEYSYALEAEATFMILNRLGGLWTMPYFFTQRPHQWHLSHCRQSLSWTRTMSCLIAIFT